ncbi:MAG TPA: magnesium transporter CorA family protein [Steroidobacteraceae bacterium]|jgi:magnesium transporter|nr:magnesium transporter CorA family protein [Steroidobacteraceae bacterium]
MLTAYAPTSASAGPPDPAGSAGPAGAGAGAGRDDAAPFWVDLLDPTPQERTRVTAQLGVQVPSRASLQEIETSSRTRAEGQVLYVSMPLTLQDATAALAPVPLGFILSPRLLVTVRFSEVHAFAAVAAHVRDEPHTGSAAVFCALIDGMVDFSADTLEKLSTDLAAVSARVFAHGTTALPRGRGFARALRESLGAVGTVGDHLSRIRESVLGLQRIISFVSETAADWLQPELKVRLKTARQDLASLVDFEAHLSGKTQFLLDAVLGFINTEQNDIFKILTIVSVVGIPPTLIASMYGMNFHYMPELSWRWGYAYGLGLIALSTLVPILWFKRRGWW